MERLTNWVTASPTIRLPILIAIIGLLGTILGGLLTKLVWPWLKVALEKIWDNFEGHIFKRKFEHRYLDWVVTEHEFLPILPSTLVPVTSMNVQRLDRLYVSLSLESTNTDSAEVSLHKLLKENPALIIIGDPGAGKTTMLRFLALSLAQARRKRSSAKKLKDRILDTTRIKNARNFIRRDCGFRKVPLPIFIYLNRLRDVTEWPRGKSLLDALYDEWKGVDKLRLIPRDFFLDKMNRGECVFLLDAFDELATAHARDSIADHVGRLASTIPQGNKILVTSRIVGYSGQLSIFGFSVVKVQSLSWALVNDLVKKWYAILEEDKLGEELLRTLESNQRIADLAVNPMLLSLIVLVQYVRRIIPDKRHLLYDECIKILVERRYAPPDVQRGYDTIIHGEEAQLVLKRIAKSLHEAHLREVSRRQLCENILPKILSDLKSVVPSHVKADDVLRNIEERSQLLIERGIDESGDPVMAFSHLTFQEYLTAKALKEDKNVEVGSSESLINNYLQDPDWWEEVALLYAGQLAGSEREAFFSMLHRN